MGTGLMGKNLEKYDPEIIDWPIKQQELKLSISTYKFTENFWLNTFELVFNNEIDTWDYQFSYMLLNNNGKCIVPRVNLITNFGFGADGTHTFSADSVAANLKNMK